MTLLQVGDQILDYNELGGDTNATPLIFIHGILSSQHTWLDFPLRFKHYGRIITLSLPGHYPAQFPADMPQATITDSWVGDTVAAAVQQITGGKPAILIGHSTGGYASLAVAWRAPELVTHVISLAGFARGIWTSILGVAQRLQYLGPLGTGLFHAQVTLGTRNALMLDTTWKMCSYDKTAYTRGSLYQTTHAQMMAHVSHIDAKAMRMWFYQMRNVADLTPYLPLINIPVLAIAGKQDSLVPSSQATHIAEGVPNGTGVLLDKMNHALFVEQPERVYICMSQWLDAQFTH
jgi:pimeloyl-ACP methyl ester carboxylesterase